MSAINLATSVGLQKRVEFRSLVPFSIAPVYTYSPVVYSIEAINILVWSLSMTTAHARALPAVA